MKLIFGNKINTRDKKQRIFLKMLLEISIDENIMYKLKDNSGRLTMTKLEKNSYEFLTTGILNSKIPWKFIFRLIKNQTFHSWSSAGVFLVKKGIPREMYNKIAFRLQNNISEEHFFGVWCNNNCPINLEVVKKSTGNLKLDEGPIQVSID